MFTGIVEEIGIVRAIQSSGEKKFIKIGAKEILKDIKLGDSIAVNGVCLTVSAQTKGEFTADVINETWKRSSLNLLRTGSPVNLERAMAAGGRFGGHIVSGHIDGMGEIDKIWKDENAVWIRIRAGKDIMRYIVEKGSIAIDGVSLTVAEETGDWFHVSIIPHTAAQTILLSKKAGERVNLENDIVGKYVEKMMMPAAAGRKSQGVTMDFLTKTGFL